MDVQGIHGSAVAVPDQPQVDGPAVVVGQHVGQVRVHDRRPQQDLRRQRGGRAVIVPGHGGEPDGRSAHWRCGLM